MEQFIFENKLMTDSKRSFLFGFFTILIGIVFVMLYVLTELMCVAVFKVHMDRLYRNSVRIDVIGDSMQPTFSSGDKLTATSILSITYGSIVVIDYNNPESEYDYIVKTVVAMEGDRVELAQDNSVRVYKRPRAPTVFTGILDTFGYRPQSYCTIATNFHERFDYPSNITRTLKEGEFFVMGDNFNHSTDSTDALVGIIKLESIKYQVLGVKSVFHDRLN